MSLTRRSQDFIRKNLTLEDVLPTRMPVYVNSVAYLFGAAALMGFFLLIVTGLVMALFGPNWYHLSGTGHFVNSLHFWSTQIFFLAIILHLATKFFMAAWRDKRWKTWVLGSLSFSAFIVTGLTGFLLQSSFDSQWIAVQAKDAMNAMGIGAWFNTANVGQMLTMHIAVLPVVGLILVGAHLFFVRRDSPVKPLPKKRRRDERKV
jgi:quinol-cytochrome oxidoreductase complex cytochrome b subunit